MERNLKKLGTIGYVLIVLVILFTSAWIYPVAAAALQVSQGGKILNAVVDAAGLESAASLCINNIVDGQIDLEALDLRRYEYVKR